MAEERESFLQRWARRKAEQRQHPIACSAPDAPTAERAADASPASSTGPAPSEHLPSIDDLTADSDFTAFLKEGVPEELKRLALRKLWRSDPVFANLDGLVEYGEDFAALFRNPTVVSTLFQLGQGMPGHEEESSTETEIPAEAELSADIQGAGESDPSKEVKEDASEVKNVSDNDAYEIG